MPKVVLQVERKAMTRSRTLEEKQAEPPADHPASPGKPRARAAAPRPAPAASAEPRSTITRVLTAGVRAADRKYFTVWEDNAILHYYHLHKDSQTSRAIAEALAKRVKHSVESIRDRIKRFLSRVQPADQTLIHEEAKANPGHYVHFARENNKKKRTVTHISSAVPKVAGSTLSMTEKRILARELARQKKLKLAGAFVGSPRREAEDGSAAVKSLTTDELFKLRDEHERSVKEKSAQYSTKLRKRSPKAYRSSTEFLSPVLKRPSRREFFRQRAEQQRERKLDLESKVEGFFDQLHSTREEDVEVNAHILSEIMKSFSLTFGVSSDAIADVLAQQDGDVNVEELRKKILALAK